MSVSEKLGALEEAMTIGSETMSQVTALNIYRSALPQIRALAEALEDISTPGPKRMYPEDTWERWVDRRAKHALAALDETLGEQA